MLLVNVRKKLADYTLQLRFSLQNEVMVLFGHSGCGKSTTLRTIAGLTNPDEGEIRLDNTTFFSSEKKLLMPTQKRRISYMFQDFALFPHMSVKQNIWYGVKNHDEDAIELYNRLLLLLKIEHLIDRPAVHLSGGEKQRVALSRALMAKPRLLLLDEPTSSLDSKTRLELQEELQRIHDLWQIPFILVTHDMEEAQKLGHQILFIENGRQTDLRQIKKATAV